MDIKKSITTNMFWRFAERILAQLVAFVVSVVIARILDPDLYGTVGLITVFTAVFQVFVDSGLGNALIQKKDADDLDFSTVFYTNIIFCCVLYSFLFFSSPLIARFYKDMTLVPYIKVLGLTLVISGVKNIQQAYVSKHLMFRKFFFATLGGTITAGIVGILMALKGLGVWALIGQHITNLFIDTLILWITVKWRPIKKFSFERLKILFSYGWKLLVSALLDTGYKELRQLIIGKVYTKSDLAFYDQGSKIPNLIVTNVNSSIDSVLLPAMSAVQDNKDKVRIMTRRAIKTSTYIMMPLMTGLAVCAESLITILLKEKWLPCVFYLRIFCFSYAFYSVHTANLNAIKALGRSDLFLKLEIIKKIIGLIALVSTMFISVKAMALSLLVTSVLGQIINAWPNKKLLNYHYPDQLRDMLPSIGLSCLMGTIVFGITFLHLNVWITLLLQVLIGIVVYVLCSKIFHIDSYEFILGIIKGYLEKRKRST